MASHAAAAPEEILTGIDGLELDVAAGQHHVRRVTALASGLGVFFRKQWPEPVFVISVIFLNARGGATVALMAGGASELVRIVNLQQFRIGMAGERLCVFVRLF